MNMPYQQPMMNYTPNYGAYQYNPMASYQRYQQSEPTQRAVRTFSHMLYPKITSNLLHYIVRINALFFA